MEIDKKNYADYIKEITPVHNLWASMGKAFITGGLICTLGQLIMNRVTKYLGAGGRGGRCLDFHYPGIFERLMYRS